MVDHQLKELVLAGDMAVRGHGRDAQGDGGGPRGAARRGDAVLDRESEPVADRAAERFARRQRGTFVPENPTLGRNLT
ncbi:hypothetical protein ACWD0G_29285 [Streptomyces goshikiensis]